MLIGTFDGMRFSLTEPAKCEDRSPAGHSTAMNFTSPCAEPAGGWAPVDRGMATEAALTAAIERASSGVDYAGLWLDQNTRGGGGENDPATLVLNVRYTGDLAVHGAELRPVWGGSLCLPTARHTEAELQRIQSG